MAFRSFVRESLFLIRRYLCRLQRRLDRHEQQRMGLLDEAEIRRLEAEDKRLDAEDKARQEEHDRRVYEALKARFEPDKVTPHTHQFRETFGP